MKPIDQFIQTLQGTWDNKQQAFRNPSLFAHIIVNIQPIANTGKQFWFEQNQAYHYRLSKPYRRRFLLVQETNQPRVLAIRHYKKEEDSQGNDEYKYLEGCDMFVVQQGKNKLEFHGTIPEGSCWVNKGEQKTCLKSELLLTPQEMRTLDQGFDPQSGKQVWGSVNGEFIFNKNEA